MYQHRRRTPPRYVVFQGLVVIVVAVVCVVAEAFVMAPSSSASSSSATPIPIPSASSSKPLAAVPTTSSSSDSIITSTDTPPLLDVPVWSMATLNAAAAVDTADTATTATTNLNLVTYVTPVTVRPDRIYAIGLFKKTLSHTNFLRTKSCILQLLTDDHTACIKVLGGQSGRDINKELELRHTYNIELQSLPSSSSAASPKEEKGEDNDYDDVPLPKVLPGCVQYLKLSLVGKGPIPVYDNDDSQSQDEACHDVVLCKVEDMWTSSPATHTDQDDPTNPPSPPPPPHLSTQHLRDLGLITNLGRIAD